MKKRITAAALCIVTLFCLASCTAPKEKPINEDVKYYSFTDDSGNEISLKSKPQKVAVLFSSFAEIWLLAGGEIHATVGESIERGFADEGTVLVDSGAGKTINTELLLASEPDFVICSADIAAQTDAARLINAAGIPAAQLRVEDFEDYLRVLKIFTDITENQAAYLEYGENVKTKIEETVSRFEAAGKTAKILFIRAGSSEKSTKAKTAKEHFACAMLKRLGTYNIAESAPVLLDGLSIEEIIKQNPEYIFITTMGNERAAKENMKKTLASPAWQGLDAVKNGRYFFLPKELFQFKPNARWAEAYAYLAGILE